MKTKPGNLKGIIESVIFASKWFLIPFYLGLIITMCLYTVTYVREIVYLISHVNGFTKEIAMLTILEIVDIVMIANLVKMIITGSYHSFVSKEHSQEGEKVTSGYLKVKLSASLTGVSSIHLLQSFINISKTSWDELNKQLLIHGAFILGGLVLMLIDYLHYKTDVHDKIS
jgi:uncharacterized protein (TIGR00645 family)